MEEVREGYKYVKGVGEIPEEWKVKKFKDVFKISQGLQIPISKRYNEEGPNRYFYITNQFLKEKNNDNVTKYFIENPLESVICNEEDILMTRTGNTGIVLTNVEGVFHNNFFKIQYDKNKTNKEFIVYMLNSFNIQKFISIYVGASTIPDLNHSDFYRISFALPSIEEQQKISQILSTWDEAIDKTEKLIEDKKLQKKGLMQQLLTGKKRLKEFEGEEWKKVKLENLFEERNEKSDDIQKYPLYSLLISEGLIEKIDRYERSFLLKNKSENKYKIVYKNDFVYNPMNLRFGAIAKVNINKTIAVSAYYNVFKTKIKNIDVTYLEMFLKSNYMLNLYNTIAIGSLEEKKRVHYSNFKKLKILIPSLQEQRAIANILTTADKQINLLEQKLQVLKEQKKGLMQNLLTGKVRVKV